MGGKTGERQEEIVEEKKPVEKKIEKKKENFFPARKGG